MAEKNQSAEAHVRGNPPPEADAGVDEHGLAVLSVESSDLPDAEFGHKVAAANPAFDPNAALRGKMGSGPGLQDSEALRPAVWTDVDSEEARKNAADNEIKVAEANLARAKKRAQAIRKGEPLDQEAGLG